MPKIVVGAGSCGIAAGAQKVYDALHTELAGKEGAALSVTGCNGMCFLEPIVDLYDDQNNLTRLVRVKPQDAEAIVGAALSGDLSAVQDLVISDDDAQFLLKRKHI